jgi:hypothetical protein
MADSNTVTVFNFVRAETDTYLGKYARQGGFGKFMHLRQPTPIDRQEVIRMQRDTLYSMAVLDLTEPATIVRPDAGRRFKSMLIVNQDHSMLPVEYGDGEFELTREKAGTQFAAVILRIFVDANDPEDVKAGNALQDQFVVRQKSPGTFRVPDWDQASLSETRDALNVLAKGLTDARGCFGDKSKLDPIRHLLGTAFGWGGNPDDAAIYDNVTPAKNDGITPHALTVKDVPVDGFWSVTVYDDKGFMRENDQHAYSFNNVTAARNADGSVTINFGGGPDAPNNLPIVAGWNYLVRMYRPRAEIREGTWSFPKAEPVS